MSELQETIEQEITLAKDKARQKGGCGHDLMYLIGCRDCLREAMNNVARVAVQAEREEMIAWFESPCVRRTMTANEIRECIRERGTK